MDFNGNIVSTESTAKEKRHEEKTVVAKEKRDEEKIVSVTDINEDLSIEVSKISLHETAVHPLKKRLIVLDINGLLAAIVSPPPKDRKPDISIGRRASKNGYSLFFMNSVHYANLCLNFISVYKRPSYLDFLEFCLEKFEVGIWSSRLKYSSNYFVYFSFLFASISFCERVLNYALWIFCC